MLRKLGFFHFCGEDRSDPAGSLRASLIEAAKDEDISGSLVVTPEAFNIRNGYWSDDRHIDPSIRTALTELSAKFKIALVAGLIEDGDAKGPGYSSAYLIDGQRLPSANTQDEEMMDRDNYRCCTGDCDQAIEYRGTSIAALICMDAADFGEGDRRHAAVLERMARVRDGAEGSLCSRPHDDVRKQRSCAGLADRRCRRGREFVPAAAERDSVRRGGELL